jgi:hypothetical protein
MKMLGIAIAVLFAGLVLWAIAADATPLSSATSASNRLQHDYKLAQQRTCNTECWTSAVGTRECRTTCY